MATIRDVAKRVGVSISTVSKVLNNPSYGLPETRAQVNNAIKELGYYPSSVARSMVIGRTQMIAIVIPDIRNPFFTEVARGVEDEANKHDYRVMFCNTDEDPSKQQNYINMFKSKIVDGFILAAASEEDPMLQELDGILPYVLIDRKVSGLTADTVVVNNRNGAYKATSHLLGLGYRKIGMIAGKRDTLTGRERLQGYIDAHKDAKVEVFDDLVVDGVFTIDGGYKATKEVLNSKHKLDALFVSNNAMTTGCLKALLELKIKVPNDMAFVSFDDPEWAGFFSPPLTVIKQPTYSMGSIAGTVLFQKILSQENKKEKEIVLEPDLIIRDSCGVTLQNLEKRN